MALPTVGWAFLHEWRIILCGQANAIRAVSLDSGLCQVHTQDRWDVTLLEMWQPETGLTHVLGVWLWTCH